MLNYQINFIDVELLETQVYAKTKKHMLCMYSRAQKKQYLITEKVVEQAAIVVNISQRTSPKLMSKRRGKEQAHCRLVSHTLSSEKSVFSALQIL